MEGTMQVDKVRESEEIRIDRTSESKVLDYLQPRQLSGIVIIFLPIQGSFIPLNGLFGAAADGGAVSGASVTRSRTPPYAL